MTMAKMIVCAARSTVPQALEVAKQCGDIAFHLVVEYLPSQLAAEVASVGNVKSHSTVRSALMAIPQCDTLLTFGCSMHPAHKIAAGISLVFEAISKPRFDIQHGLLQEGYSLNLDPFGEEANILADERLDWRYLGVPLPRIRRGQGKTKRIGIATNLHWSVYSDRERAIFRNCVVDAARVFPDHRFIWRPHPAEFKFVEGEWPAFDDLGVERCNIAIQSFIETERVSTAEFLSEIDVLITTPSTTMIDAERAQLPCAVLRSTALSHAVSKLERVPSFRSAAELTSLLGEALSDPGSVQIKSGYSFGVRPDRLIDRFMARSPSSPMIPEEQVRLGFSIYRNFAEALP